MNDAKGTTAKPVIEAKKVIRMFRRKAALDGATLEVPQGLVYGLVGENGAGKTTLIKLLLGLLQPSAGQVRVFGLDPVVDPVGVLSRVGYLSEDRDLPNWMRISELIEYTKAFYPGWDDAFAEELRRTFDLDPQARIRHLSRGERAKAGLLISLAYRPELLILDEPSSGLDPVVRRHILGAIIRTVADEGRTVFFSSHLLDEVERVADHVAMIHHGKIVLTGSLDDIKAGHHRLVLRFEENLDRAPALAGALDFEGSGKEWTAVCNGQLEELRQAATDAGARVAEETVPSLEEIFVARVTYAETRARELGLR